jgi:hypothetical protein
MNSNEFSSERRGFLKSLASFVGVGLLDNALGNPLFAEEYLRPEPGKWIERKKANFEIFPNKLEFVPGRKILVVSNVWQTAALYDEKGDIVYHTTKEGEKIKFVFQVSTGVEHKDGGNETEAGLYELQDNHEFDFTSGTYPKPNGGGNMYYAQFFGKVIEDNNGNMISNGHNGEAIHGSQLINSKSAKAQDSRGCIRMHIAVAKFLKETLKNKRDNKRGDFVLVIEEEVPKVNNIKSLID